MEETCVSEQRITRIKLVLFNLVHCINYNITFAELDFAFVKGGKITGNMSFDKLNDN